MRITSSYTNYANLPAALFFNIIISPFNVACTH